MSMADIFGGIAGSGEKLFFDTLHGYLSQFIHDLREIDAPERQQLVESKQIERNGALRGGSKKSEFLAHIVSKTLIRRGSGIVQLSSWPSLSGCLLIHN